MSIAASSVGARPLADRGAQSVIKNPPKRTLLAAADSVMVPEPR